MDRGEDAVAQALDGATGDYAVSGDAMRWSPDLAEQPGRAQGGVLPGVDVAVGLGSVLGLDAARGRRRGSGAMLPLASAAGDVVSELRSLTRGSSSEDEPG